jgi:putative tricarboxylic transport membrane protein
MTFPASPTQASAPQPRWRLVLRTDVLAGLMFIALGAFALIVSRNYPIGTALRMGTGYVPRLLAWVLVALGLLTIVQDLWTRTPQLVRDADQIGVARPMLFITAAIVVFGLTIERLGLVIAILLLVAIGSFAGQERRPVETVIAAIVMAAASVGIFVWGLGLTIPIWPEW